MMADPDIRPDPSLDDNTKTNIDISKEKIQGLQNDSFSSIRQQRDDDGIERGDVVFHYLEFETDIPTPAYLAQPESTRQQHHREPPPECPDLNKYTSPFLWADSRKSMMIWISCVATMFTAYNAGAYTSGLDQMTEEWHISRVAGLVGVTTFTCGFGVAPMFLAPFSEINGRRPMFLVTGVLWVIFQIVCAVTPAFSGMLVARFLVGCFSSTFSTMVGGVISDIYHAKDRNTGMTLFSASALFGTGFGPLIGGFIGQRVQWRWLFYHQIIMDTILMVFIVFFFKETRGSVLLSRKANQLNKYYEALEAAGYYGVLVLTTSHISTQQCPEKSPTSTVQRIRWKVLADEERTSITTMIRISLIRPFHMLITEPVVFFFSVWISFSWAVLYMNFSAVPLIFQTTYGFSLEQGGAVFAAVCIACILFTPIAIYQERICRRYLPARQQLILDSPEGRLYFACLESALLPIGCLWFGISGAYPQVPWIIPAIGVAIATMGIFSIYLSVFNYLADAYHRYASSALAAQSFCRNLLAGAFPLFTTAMFNKLTFQGAAGLLAGIGFVLTVVPWVLLLFGPKIRAKSKLAMEIMKE